MARKWFGVLVVVLAAFAAVYLGPWDAEGKGEEGLPKAPSAGTSGDSGREGATESLPKTSRNSSPAATSKPRERPLVSKVVPGGIRIFSKVPKPERYLNLPDGTFVAPLNGVQEPAPFLWPKNIPFAPIIGKELDDHGRWWYLHKDGSKSTTYMAMHPQTGKLDARTDIANPRTPIRVGGEGSSK